VNQWPPLRGIALCVALVTPVLLTACGGGATPVTPLPSPTPTPPPPNIILVMADDLEAQSLEYMPKLKSLITDKGLKLANSFAPTPLCCPSRASVLTGQYAHNHGVLSNGPPRGGFDLFKELGRESSTIATWLKAAGYRTALFGKYLNQYPAGSSETYVPPGWDEWFGVLEDRRAELALYTLNENGKILLFAGRSPTDYQTDVLSTKAVDFIRRAETNDSQPFFMWMGVAAPHVPAIPPDRYDGGLGGVEAPRTAGFNEDDVSDKPRYLRQTAALTEKDIDQIDEEYRDRQLTLMAVDDMIGNIVQALDQAGELDNTYILFTSDNGIFQGQHRLKGKSAPY
jgi:N-acetylglucosamine-6-sulfatase